MSCQEVQMASSRARTNRVLFLVTSLLAAAWSSLQAQTGVSVDFRNRIPGVLDAPVFDADGVTRLENKDGASSVFLAQLYFSPTGGKGDFAPVGVASSFQSGANAGYWEPATVVLPGVAIGQTVRLRVNAWEQFPWIGMSSFRGIWGSAMTAPIVVGDGPLRLTGLQSFSLQPEPLRVERQSEALVLKWPNLGARRYKLEYVESLNSPSTWIAIPLSGTSADFGQDFAVTNTFTDPARFFRLQRWR
jgi:hypothetical protein